MIEKYAASGKKESERDFYVFEENWPALEIFLDMQTQWRVIATMGGAVYQGLDYSALISVVGLKCGDNAKQIFDDVRAIEKGALSNLGKKRNG